MPVLYDLLARGYFPKELPSPFTTQPFAVFATNTALVGDFAKPVNPKPKIKAAKPCRYSLARGGLLRRPLSLCHPVAHYLLCREIVNEWAAIAPSVSGTLISATHPEDKPSGRAIDGHWPQSARAELAHQRRLAKRFALHADISRFYSSIYTHSIPWALHGKQVAKTNQTHNLLGNRIDYLVRLGQDGQTIGIPIGPDTSLVIAEMLMHKCDGFLASQMPGLQGSRFIDDFELNFATQAEAENAHHLLETCLASYELALNPRKTAIFDLPRPIETVWATALKKLKPRSGVQAQAADLAILFDSAFALHQQYPAEAVLQFAISLLQFETIDPGNWQLFQRLLMLCALPEPASFPFAARLIVAKSATQNGGLIPELSSIANNLITTHSPLRHSSEVANAIWACLALQLTIGDAAVDAISGCDDPVVALLALDAENRHLTSKPIDKTLWCSHMNSAALYDEFWLLAYEANVRNWLPNQGGVDFVANDLNFGQLKTAGVHFYTPTQLPAATQPAPEVIQPQVATTLPPPSL